MELGVEGPAAIGIVLVVTVMMSAAYSQSAAYGHWSRRQRAAASKAVALRHGWRWAARDETSIARVLQGEDYGRDATNVIAGEHRGRTFVSFEHHDSRRLVGRHDIGNELAVWIIKLPATVPTITVESADPIDGHREPIDGLDRFRTGDTPFDQEFRVRCQDPSFARSVLRPALRSALWHASFRWSWRFDRDLMIAHMPGTREAADLPARLDAMADLIDAVDASVWTRRAPSDRD